MGYEERLRALDLFSLEGHKEGRDLIQAFKIVVGLA